MTALLAIVLPADAGQLPTQVRFSSRDGKTTLIGYLFLPTDETGAHPAIVMMHGRAGAYSTAAHGVYDAATLSKRHAFWGHYWAREGYVALLVDGFGPRGFPGGFPVHSYASRPDQLNEVTVRPLDAFGALDYLRARSDVDAKRIALQGWSNGGSATIASLSVDALAANGSDPKGAFVGGVAFYPACGLHGRFAAGYRSYAPLRVFAGDADEEVSTRQCATLIGAAASAGVDARIDIYPGATHDFDDPGIERSHLRSNVDAAARARVAVRAFMRRLCNR